MTSASTVKEIAEALGEREEKPLHDLAQVIDKLGADKANELLARVRDVEAEGGMLTQDASRPRTPGGIFFQLARAYIPVTPPPPRARRLTWSEAAQAAAEAADDGTQKTKGAGPQHEDSSVKITLIGRPGKVVKRDSVMITTMYNHKRPALPKQLPKFSGADVETRYTVFIAAKQWRKVEEAMRNKEDALIIEGYPFTDPEIKGICVFAKSTTTKLIQRARREAQRAQS